DFLSRGSLARITHVRKSWKSRLPQVMRGRRNLPPDGLSLYVDCRRCLCRINKVRTCSGAHSGLRRRCVYGRGTCPPVTIPQIADFPTPNSTQSRSSDHNSLGGASRRYGGESDLDDP